MPAWARLTIAAASLRIAVTLSVHASGQFPSPDPRAVPPWAFALLALSFSLVGLALVLSHQDDRRAAWLGGMLTLLACPLTTPLIAGRAGGPFEWVMRVRPEAFSAVFAWEFLACFPTDLRGRPLRIVKGVSAAGLVTGLYLSLASLLVIWTPPSSPLRGLLGAADKPSVYFWPVLLGITVPALLVLLWRARTAEGEARTRVRVFAGALMLGVLPFAIEVFVEGVFPAYWLFVHSPAVEPWVAALLFGTLASLPFTTAYSVLFDRVVSVRIVLHKALQHALARYTILALTLIPFGGLALFVAVHREEPVVALISQGWRPAVLLGLGAIGVATLRLRTRLLRALDRRYFREPYDGRRVLERLMGQSAPGRAELGARLGEEIGRAFHARVETFLIDDARTVLQHTEGRLQPLSVMTPLLRTPHTGDEVIDVTGDLTEMSLRRLPEHEQRWIAAGGFSVIAPIRSHAFGAVGLLALTPKLSELPYSDDDRRFLATVASAAGLAFDGVRLRPASAPPSEPAARECGRCLSLYASEAKHCLCGAPLHAAAVPHVLRGVFRFEQRIAHGSEGAVYRAVDLGLGRNVAIKALSRVTDDRMRAIVQEARAMARVAHPNLAMIHGVEAWRDTSFLVQEYLQQGTLAQRLSRARLTVEDALELGVTLADLLIHLHRAELMHCDIKPSNIGYTADGVLKLFDFGLARGPVAIAPPLDGAPREVVGTPFYMSPEAIAGAPPSPAFDLWALGVVLYEAIAGRRPFDGATTPDVLAAIVGGRRPPPIPGAMPALSTFFDGVFDRDPARRPSTAADVRDRLSQLRSSHVPTELAGSFHAVSDARSSR